MTEQLHTDLHVRREGRPPNEAPTLVLLHGPTDPSAGWEPAVRHWADSYSMLLVDMRGHGGSPRFTAEQLEGPPGDVLVEDTVALLDQLGESPVVVGHSLGGAVALEVTTRRPDLVRALVLEDPAPLGPDAPQHVPERGGEQRADQDSLADGEWKPSGRWPELFKELIVPALVVSGDASEEVCVDDAMEQGIEQAGNPNLRLVRVRGAGHRVRDVQPERFFEEVDAFLATH